MSWSTAALAAGLALAATGCAAGEPRTASAAQSPSGERSDLDAAAIDSALPMEVLLARFQSELPVATALDGGASSADELVERFLSAVARGDTVTLAQLRVTRAEYAWLYFPTSVYAAAPYELAPDVAWMLSTAASEKGLTRVVRRLGGAQLELRGYTCAQPGREGENRFWRDCTLAYDHPVHGPASRQLFGTIMEHGGRYKFLSYANDF